MASKFKGPHVFHIFLLNCLVIMLGAVNLSVLPISEDTKHSLGYYKDSLLNFTQLTGEYGYLSQEHTVVTEDGYVLTMFRVVGGRNCRGQRRSPPVILMHGLLQSSDSWIDAGPGAGLAYLVADACHDLWLGNTRGNYYSRRHATLDPDRDAHYWQFSVDEIGYYDLPAFIDYVLQYTGSEKVNYIGFSQGAGTYLIMCSERPEYCHKAQILIALAPATRHINTRSAMFRFITNIAMQFEGMLKETGVVEMFPKGSITQEFVASFCQFAEVKEYCDTLINIIGSSDLYHKGSVSNKTIRTLVGHFPAGTSVHNMARYGQAMRSRMFVRFDYGSERNLEVYGNVKPPEYNLSIVTVPVALIYGRNDGVVDIKDVEWLLEKLPQVLEAVLVKDPLWNHLDVTYSQYTSEAIFPKINEYLLKYSHA